MNAPRDFWSRRRAAVEAEAEADRRALAEQALASEQAALAEKTDEEILAELDLPDPDRLEPGDDIVRYMARAVPERIRRRALRKLWTLNPVLANLDGLNDYDDDYTQVATGPVSTTYQVGKGLLAHVKELARQAEAALEEPEAEVAEDAPLPLTEAEAAAEPQLPEPEAEPEEALPRAPRRMRFAFAAPEGSA
ncbi:DUF3306 domain-containing protein [Seohaeicola zhoushanensis]|uniref:DUF3306 domain-containing protein n=1 Tax=Seohaeicola zhoushanensis TaxID=1569283 RepID=A0A8J3GWE5_9RHOB|nr:DUF3306 domain-containing protein [Seohaeicola zhoushanensis]GHF43973.1 hypothetical protein GCM10017056_14870 [Seohaeicola zhoushanensis]